jgi:hypothetical protein
MTKSESSSSADKLEIAERLRKVEAYGKPKRVWVDDGHVFVEGHDGTIVSMTPEVAIELGRLIANAGAESLVNQVIDRGRIAEVGAPLAS